MSAAAPRNRIVRVAVHGVAVGAEALDLGHVVDAEMRPRQLDATDSGVVALEDAHALFLDHYAAVLFRA